MIIVLEMFYTYLNMDLDKGSSKNIQDIIVTPKERLYMSNSGKIRTISRFLGKNRKIRKVNTLRALSLEFKCNNLPKFNMKM
jgi:hypothetical protein